MHAAQLLKGNGNLLTAATEVRGNREARAISVTRFFRFSMGPLDVCATYSGEEEIHVEVLVAGEKFGDGVIHRRNPQICFVANIGLVKASVVLVADFNARELRALEACTSHGDGRWNCRRFDEKLLNW